MVTIRDVRDVSPAVAVMGDAALRDAALAAAPAIATRGATRRELARIAAALIVCGTGEEPAKYGLPALSPDDLARASEARHAAEADADPHAQLRRDLDGARYRVREVEAKLVAVEAQRDQAQREAQAAAAERDEARDQRDSARGQVTDLEADLAAAAERIRTLEAELDAATRPAQASEPAAETTAKNGEKTKR